MSLLRSFTKNIRKNLCEDFEFESDSQKFQKIDDLFQCVSSFQIEDSIYLYLGRG